MDFTRAADARHGAVHAPLTDDGERLEDPGDEMATLPAPIHAATHRLLVLLCRAHHRMLHEGGYGVELARVGEAWAGGAGTGANFCDPSGLPLPDAPPPPPASTADPREALLADHRRSGIQPDQHTTRPRWRHDDVPTVLVVRARRAADAGATPDAAEDAA